MLLFNLVHTDIGRPLDQIKSTIIAESMAEKTRQSLVSQSLRTLEVQTDQDKWHLAQIQPSRTLNNLIDGVALTFTDISQRVATEQAVKDARTFENIVETLHEPLIVLDSEINVVSAKQFFLELFRLNAKAAVGQSLFKLSEGQWENGSMLTFYHAC